MGSVTGVKYICIHVLSLEKTLKLYREILGFNLVDAEVLKGNGIEGMLVMTLEAGDIKINFSLTAPEYQDTIGPIGNNNHNHVMFYVDQIEDICEALLAEGYVLENNEFARDQYTFFEGPNGEIVGLTTS